jgi:hypothetical protein
MNSRLQSACSIMLYKENFFISLHFYKVQTISLIKKDFLIVGFLVGIIVSITHPIVVEPAYYLLVFRQHSRYQITKRRSMIGYELTPL